jgi:Cyclin-dependent kinase regulatory subunit
MSVHQIQYSEKYFDDIYEYRHGSNALTTARRLHLSLSWA